MTEFAKSKNNVPLETSIPDGAVSLESIVCTEELHRRPWRPPDYGRENRARELDKMTIPADGIRARIA